MDYIAILEKVRQLNRANKPGAALNILKHLYKLDASNIDIILEVVTAFENLGEWEKARTMLVKGIRLFPKKCDLWIRLSSIYLAAENKETALKAINKGLSYNSNYLPMLIKKSHLLADLGRVSEMQSLLDATIIKFPDNKKDLLIERASIYQSLPLHPDDEELVKDSYGMVYAVKPLRKAINDLNDAMDCDEEDFRIPIKLARLYKLLNNFELAIFTYDDALSIIDNETEEFRIKIQQERDDCLKCSRNNTVQIADSLPETNNNVELESELSRDKVKTKYLKDAKVNKLTAAKDRASVQKNNLNKPEQKKVISIARDFLKNSHETNGVYVPTKLNQSVRKYFDEVEEEIKKVGFLTLGDFEVKGLNQYLGKRVLVRLFVSKGRLVCANAVEIKPLKTSFLFGLLLVILGKWNTERFIELQSETVDGIFKITNNSSDRNYFEAASPVKIVNLKEDSSLYDIVIAHKIRLQKHSQRSYKRIADRKEFIALQQRIMVAKKVYRESHGSVEYDEMRPFPGNQLYEFSSYIRRYFEKVIGQTCEAKS